MKKIVSGIITLVILFTCNYFLSNFFGVKFLELSFMTGLMFSIIIGFFSSEGGITTTFSDAQYKRFLESDSRTKDYFMKFYTNIPFIISLVYTIIAAILSIVVYWEYFL